MGTKKDLVAERLFIYLSALKIRRNLNLLDWFTFDSLLRLYYVVKTFFTDIIILPPRYAHRDLNASITKVSIAYQNVHMILKIGKKE